jgi:hypothetical protein
VKTATQWTPTDLTGAKYIGPIEFQDDKGEWHNFEVMSAVLPSDRIVFGGACNVGFLESGFIRRENGEHLDDTLREMLADLEVYYNDGPRYVSRIVCNECM